MAITKSDIWRCCCTRPTRQSALLTWMGQRAYDWRQTSRQLTSQCPPTHPRMEAHSADVNGCSVSMMMRLGMGMSLQMRDVRLMHLRLNASVLD